MAKGKKAKLILMINEVAFDLLLLFLESVSGLQVVQVTELLIKH